MSEENDSVEFTLPSDPNARKKIKDALHEMSGALQFIADKREYMKDVAEALSEEYDIPKKIINKMAKTLYNNDYGDVNREGEQFSLVYETLFPSEVDPE